MRGPSTIDGLAALGVRDLVLNFARATLDQSLASPEHLVTGR